MKDAPLVEVVRDRRFDEILGALRNAIRAGQPITIAPKDVDYIRRSFHRGIRLGERRLHQLARMFLGELAPDSKIKTTFVIWGRCSKPAHSEVLKEHVPIHSPEKELYSRPDSEVSEENAPICPRCGLKTRGILSFVQYQPDPIPESGLVLLSTRIKTTSNLCYKIADMVFDIDRMFQRDKIRGRFSQTVTDVYGIKVILRNGSQIWEVLKRLRRMTDPKVLEEKDYIGARKKKSGFEVYKVIARSRNQLIEIQLQSKAMFESEETSLPASHRTYKEKQKGNRRKLGKEYVELYRVLTQLFAPAGKNFCEIDYVELGYTKKGLDDEF